MVPAMLVDFCWQEFDQDRSGLMVKAEQFMAGKMICSMAPVDRYGMMGTLTLRLMF